MLVHDGPFDFDDGEIIEALLVTTTDLRNRRIVTLLESFAMTPPFVLASIASLIAR